MSAYLTLSNKSNSRIQNLEFLLLGRNLPQPILATLQACFANFCLFH
jgi:hypothetical protein